MGFFSIFPFLSDQHGVDILSPWVFFFNRPFSIITYIGIPGKNCLS